MRIAAERHAACETTAALGGRGLADVRRFDDMDGVKLSEETIKRPLDECACNWCGCSLQVGDTVFVDLEHGMAYCSRACAEQDAFDAGYGPLCPGASWW
jgi:Prokaryotic metallothionein